RENTVTDDYSTVGGGELNQATSNNATVSGGGNNRATAPSATVGGGSGNQASAAWATVPGGRYNEAAGAASFAAGYRAKADHDYTFVWGDYDQFFDFNSTGDNQFLISASGGVGIGTNDPTTQLDVNGTIKSRSGGFEFPDATIQTTAAIIEPVVTAPIGSVVAWIKSYASTPALPEGWIECNGQSISDTESPYYQSIAPNLNSTGRFLRGAASTGNTGGSVNHDHTVTLPPAPVSQLAPSYFCAPSGTHTTSNRSHLPPYYTVVWIMRIK
ncbi:MAG: hypothetical protein JSU65_04165, partial [Candidatus Zixiibacteriota bacterium]